MNTGIGAGGGGKRVQDSSHTDKIEWKGATLKSEGRSGNLKDTPTRRRLKKTSTKKKARTQRKAGEEAMEASTMGKSTLNLFK